MKVGDKVDARDLRMGAWFEAEVVKLTTEATPPYQTNGESSTSEPEKEIIYHVKFDE